MSLSRRTICPGKNPARETKIPGIPATSNHPTWTMFSKMSVRVYVPFSEVAQEAAIPIPIPVNSGVFLLILLLLVFWAGWDAVHIIDEAERGVVLRFGKYSRELQPGINLTLPRPIESLTKVNVSSVRSVDDRGHMLTEDENLIEFDYQVQYRVSNAQDYLFQVRSVAITLQEAAESALRESVGTNTLDDILEGSTRERVRQESQKVLQETLDRYQAGNSDHPV